MSAFKPLQRHLTIRGRTFHFVSYEGQPADARRSLAERPSMWYLMVEGRRFPAFPCDPSTPLTEIDQLLSRWAEDNATGPADGLSQGTEPTSGGPNRRPVNWWGPI